MSVDIILWLAGSLAEAAVIALLLYRRVWRSFPLFLAYNVWALTGNALYVIIRIYPTAYVTISLLFVMIDSALLFSVLVELGISILRPVRASLPRGAPLAVACVILVVGAVIWPFAAFPGAVHLSREAAALTHLQEDFRILRVLAFLVLAACSQFLSIGWRDRELQIATGLGFTSLVGLAVAMLHTHQTTVAQYNYLNRFVVASYLCSLLYWVVSFAQQEEERREFTPQMQNLLLAVAGAARTTRITLENPGSGKGLNKDR